MQVVTECQDDCVGILRAGASWLSATQSVAPTDIVLDTATSGVRYTGPGVGTRVVRLSAIDRLTASTGMRQINGAAIVECFQKRGAVSASCRPLQDKLLLAFQPPRLNMKDSTEASLVIRYARNVFPAPPYVRYWAGATYELTLKRETGGWRVAGARLVDQT
jgi:hypothetical protein